MGASSNPSQMLCATGLNAMCRAMTGRWWILGFLFLISVMTYVDRANIAVAAAPMGRDLGLTRLEFGLVFSAFVLGYALFQIPGGWLGDHFGHKRVLTVALLWWSAFTALTAWIVNSAVASALGVIPTLCVVRFLIGTGEAAAYPCALGLVKHWFAPHERGRITAVIFAGIGVGSAITPPLTAWLMVNVGWRFGFYAAGALGVALALAFHLLVPDRPDEGGREQIETRWKTILTNDQLWQLTTISFLGGYVVYIYFFWFYLYLVDVRGFTLLRGALWAALPFVSMALGSLVGGVLTDRAARRIGRTRARRLIALTGLFSSTLFLVAGAIVPDAFAAIASLSVAAGLLSMVPGITWAAALEIDPGRTATILGIIQTGASLGGVLSPVLTPWIAARYGWASALGVGAAATLTAALLWTFMAVPKAQSTIQDGALREGRSRRCAMRARASTRA